MSLKPLLFDMLKPTRCVQAPDVLEILLMVKKIFKKYVYFMLCYRFCHTCKQRLIRWGGKISNATRSSSRSFYREICVRLTTVAGNDPVAGRNLVINTKQEALLRTSPYKCVEIRLRR